MATFQSVLQGNILLIQCPLQITGAMNDQIEMLTKSEWVQTDADTVVFNFKDVREFSEKAYRPLIQYHRIMSAQRKRVMSINVSMPIREQWMRDGMMQIFSPVESLADAVDSRIKGVKSTIDAEFFTFFANAVRETFKIQCKIEVTVERAKVGQKDPLPNIQVASVLNLDADEFHGTLILAFPESSLLGIYQAMLSETAAGISDGVLDAAGELLNIIFGVAKRGLVDKKGFTVRKAIPVVLSGNPLEIQRTAQTKVSVVLPCKAPQGEFFVEVQLGPPRNG